MPPKTDANNPAGSLIIAAGDLDVIQLATGQQLGFPTCRRKLAEVLEKVLKAELLRLSWPLEN